MNLGLINSAFQQVGIDTATGLKQAIKELNNDGTVSIELEYAPDPAHIGNWVEKAYRETARLMYMVGLRN